MDATNCSMPFLSPLLSGYFPLHGKNPHLSSIQMTELIVGLMGIGFVALLLVFGVHWVLRRFGRTSIYDMRLVAEKTGRSAYRVRLRLFVIEANLAVTRREIEDAVPARRCQSLLYMSIMRQWRSHEMTLARISEIHQQWVQFTQQKRERTSAHKALLDRLTAAYRQYHLAAGGYFVPHAISQAKAQRLLARRSGLARVFSDWAGDLRRSKHL